MLAQVPGMSAAKAAAVAAKYPTMRTLGSATAAELAATLRGLAIVHAITKRKTCTPRQSLHAPIQDVSTISKNKASVLHRNLDASPPRFPDKNREHGGGYGASRNWIILMVPRVYTG